VNAAQPSTSEPIPAEIRLSVQSHGRRSRIRVTGALDLATATHLRTAIEQVSRAGQVVSVDLRTTTFCDCAGLNVLVAGQCRLRAIGGALVITRPSVAVARLLTLTGLDRHFDVRPAGATTARRRQLLRAVSS
jgi:anti-sigma B factor antagonist